MQPGAEIDLVRDYAAEIPTTIIAEMLGVPVRDRLKFRKWSNVGAAAGASRFGIVKAIPHLVLFHPLHPLAGQTTPGKATRRFDFRPGSAGKPETV